MTEMMSRLAIMLVRIAFVGDCVSADRVTDYLDGTLADSDWRGAWRATMAVAPYSDSPIGRAVRAVRQLRGREVAYWEVG